MPTDIETIAGAIATDIRTQVYAPGEMLPSERELCQRFGAGRSTIRAAISNLGVLGMLDLSHGKRPRVAALDLARVVEGAGTAMSVFLDGLEGRAHMEQARLFMETSMVRYAAEHATRVHIAKMVDAIETCDASIDDREAFLVADVRFHRILAEIPGNPIFIALHEAFVAQLMRSRTTPGDVQKYLRRSNEEHKQIVSAIIEKDPEKAISVLTQHLERNYTEQFRAQLGQSAGWHEASSENTV